VTIRAHKSLIFICQIIILVHNINKQLLVILVTNNKKIIKMYKHIKIIIKSSKLKNNS
jgi:hypothetical protein